MSAVVYHVPNVSQAFMSDRLADQGQILDGLATAYAQISDASDAKIDGIDTWKEELGQREPLTEEIWTQVTSALEQTSGSPRIAYVRENLG
jgi:hypothetical protein